MPRDDPPTTPHPSRRALGPPQDEETARSIKSQEARRTEGPTGKPLRPRHEAFCQHFDLLGKLEAVYQCAIDKQSLHTAARCVEIQARISGLGGGKGREEEKPQSAQRSQRKSGEGKF